MKNGMAALQVKCPEGFARRVRVAAASEGLRVGGYIIAALKAKLDPEVGEPEELPHERNARLRREAVEGEEVQP